MTITYKDKAPKDYTKADFSQVAGLPAQVGLRKFALAVRKAVIEAKKEKLKKVAVVLKEIPKLGLSDFETGEIVAREALLADYEFTKYLSKPKDGWKFISELAIVGKASPEFKKGVARGKLVAGEINMCRELSNTPGGDMTPSVFADSVREALGGLRQVKVSVLGKAEMEKLGMGAVLGVAKGSVEEPKFVIAEYMGAGKSERPIVLVGKGVTFDTGGINLKPSDGGSLNEMHLDMSGGAAVVHTLALAAKLGLKKNVVALVPTVENMPSGSSYRPGDVLRSLSGKSIEIKNTDAEGRVILADALTYAKGYDPRLVVDVATLTGAIMVALGARMSGLFGDNEKLMAEVKELGDRVGDPVWPMPLWEEHEDEVKGTFGDVANLGKHGRYGGAIAAAAFLKQFTKDYPKGCSWLHLDIAGTMLPSDDEHLAKGAKGAPVKLLLALVENF